ncbi:MAG TPA: response regulator [Caldisericia bacterium]|nr:response regulator [Caldisericia bacterium]
MAKILILDDDQIRHDAFKRALIGHLITHVYTSKECIEKLNTETWDIVFLDHDLGEQVYIPSGENTGYEVAEWLRDNPEKQPKQIIIHSYNSIGARNMLSLLPKAVYHPGCWMYK